jgi:VWFA-related protein
MKWLCGWLALTALLAGDSRAVLEPRPRAKPAAPEAALRVDTNLVLIPVSVTDPLDHPVPDLRPAHFQVFEDGVEQRITQFSREETAISAGLLFDTSGSIGKQIVTSRETVDRFLKSGGLHDEYFLIKFAQHVELAAAFTNRPETLQQKLFFTRPEGGTAFLDAVYLGLQQMNHARNPRRVLLVVSDGADNSSRYSRGEVFALARESDVQIYTVGVFASETWGARLLDRLAEQTGGRYYRVSRRQDLAEIAARIGEEIRHQYVLGYHPGNPERDGKFRRLQVRVNPPPGSPKLRVTARAGYYAPAR